MVNRRRPKELYGPDRDRLVDAMGRCRGVVTRSSSEVEYGSPTYQALDVLRKAIDSVAAVVTGDAELYWCQGTTNAPKWVDRGTK